MEFASEAVTSVAGSLASVDLRYLALALGLQLVAFAMRSAAWRNVLRAAYPGARVSTLDVASSTAAGAVCNGVGVAQAGNAVKVLLVRSRISGSAVPAIAGTLGVTAVFDLVAGGVGLAIAWRLGVLPDAPLPAPSPLVLGAGASVVLVAAALCWLLRARLGRLFGDVRANVLAAFSVLRTPGRYLREVAAVQALAWAARLSLVFCMLHAFHIPASFTDALLVVVIGGIAGALPTGPGGAGTQQLAIAFALHGTCSTATAISFSIGMQVAITLVNIGLGCGAAMVLFGTMRPHLLLRRARVVVLAARTPAPTPATADAGP